MLFGWLINSHHSELYSANVWKTFPTTYWNVRVLEFEPKVFQYFLFHLLKRILTLSGTVSIEFWSKSDFETRCDWKEIKNQRWTIFIISPRIQFKKGSNVFLFPFSKSNLWITSVYFRLLNGLVITG